MFYKLIERKRDAWLADKLCPVTKLMHYILQRGMLRDAQIEAIKTYLYLKIVCGNKKLAQARRISWQFLSILIYISPRMNR